MSTSFSGALPFAAKDNRGEDQSPGDMAIFDVSSSRGVDGETMLRDLFGDRVTS